jgi:predicted DNA-binding transcriptional regulator AlpA
VGSDAIPLRPCPPDPLDTLHNRPAAESPASLAPPLLVRRVEAARLCGVSPATWDRLDAAGKTPTPVRLGGAKLYRVAELEEWCAAGCPPRTEWEVRKAAVSGRN